MLLLGTAAAIVLLLPIKTPLHLYDEGFAVFNAVRILAGDAPYKDFWAIYPPGQSYTLAAVFGTFGTTLGAARVYDTVVCVAVVIGLYLIAARFLSPILAALSGLIGVLLLAPARSYGYAVFPAFALGLLAVRSALEYGPGARRRWLIISGALVGLASLYRWDVGLYALISVAVSVALRALARTNDRWDASPSYGLLTRSMLLVIASALAIAALLYGAVIARSGVLPLWEQVFVFPTTRLHSLRVVPIPPLMPAFVAAAVDGQGGGAPYAEFLMWLRFYLPLAIYAAVFARQGLALVRVGPVPRARDLVTVAVFGLLLFAQAVSRYDYVHVLPTSMVAFLILVVLLAPPHRLHLRSWRNVAALSALAVVLLLYFAVPVRGLVYSMSRFSPFACYSSLPRASCAFVDADQEEAIEYVRARTRPAEPIFVGNRRHDLIFLNDVGFYFLSERSAATHYHDLFPGVATTFPVQRDIVADLEATDVRWIVLVDAPLPNEPNASAASSGVTYLDEFIRSAFVPLATFGDYEIWHREPSAPSQPHTGLG